MIKNLCAAFIETLYASVIIFIYYYTFKTLVQLKPFSFTFNPPTNIDQLIFIFAIIVGGIFVFKLSTFIFIDNDTETKVSTARAYVPSNRKMI